MRRRKALAVVIAMAVCGVLVGAALAVVTGGGSTTQPPTALESLSATLVVSAPASAEAGDVLTVVVDGADDASEVRLDLISSVGVKRLKATATDGRATFTVDPDSTRIEGQLIVLATTDTARGQATVDVRAGNSVDGIVPLAGPRSMVADTAHWTMVTAIPTDALGNGLADGTVVTLHVRRPDGRVEQIDSTLDGLLTGIRVFSGTRAGTTTVRVDVDGATGAEVQVEEVPGQPVAVDIEGPTSPVRADGRSLVDLTTGVLADQYGNVLLDGTSARLVGEGPDGDFSIVGSTIEGRATFHIQAPTEPGRVQFVVYVDGVASAPVSFAVGREIDDAPVTVTRLSDNGRVRVDIGPVMTELGGRAPDGSKVTVTTPDGTTYTGQLFGGSASIEFAVEPDVALVVEVLGVRVEAIAP